MHSLNVTNLLGPRTNHPKYKSTYSRDDRSYVYKVEGSRKSSINLSNLSSSRGISYHYLVLQVKVISNFTITITIRDDKTNHFNFAFSTATRKTPDGGGRPSSSQTCALIGLDLPKDTWVTVYFDLEQISRLYWVSGTYHYLDSIEVSPSCVVRWIFAQEELVYGDGGNIELPRGLSLEYPAGIENTTIIIPQQQNPTRKSKIPTRVSINSSNQTSTSSASKPKSHQKSRPTTTNTNTNANINTNGGSHISSHLIHNQHLVKGSSPSRHAQSDKPGKGSNQRNNQPDLTVSAIPARKSENVKGSAARLSSNSRNSAFELAEEDDEIERIDDLGNLNHNLNNNNYDDYDDDDSDGSAFGGDAPRYQTEFLNTDAEMHTRLPDDEEDELELVYIEPLGCYYCPSNQQYYQLDDK
ncbi:hypothetical protein TRFO_41307 [Tritrichomonas foetus]|uniref:CFA20 domain-containing protein n=1 Tax=Tritrichomonas foetus TaxID=1144522 RepID=A0A1J4L517_9EUKA|nr:hypothetical protein TRFO_41307 [Tritrichomonas foetus]|eukprot:OHT17084.1 hypothetical protein TRFO_41307 [Tritrichomonas foetus]